MGKRFYKRKIGVEANVLEYWKSRTVIIAKIESEIKKKKSAIKTD